jgi:glycosyltransferase involved in cell wall biosynthesis
MKRVGLTRKRLVQKKMELHNKQLRFYNKKKMDELDRLRIYGLPKKSGEQISELVKQVEMPKNPNIKYPITKFSLSRKIPKRIFFYWGGSDMSWMRYMTLYSFRKMNPDWETVLYVSENTNKNKSWKGVDEQDYYMYTGNNYFKKLKKLGVKIEKAELPVEVKKRLKGISPIHESDLFRYYQLFLNGGLYCDMDVLFFKPINDFYNKITEGGYDTIIHEYKAFDANESDEWWMTIGFLGASPNNEYYKNMFEYAVNNYKEDNYQSMGVYVIYGLFNTLPFKQTYNKIVAQYPCLKFYNLSTELIYYYDWTKVEECFTNSIGINDFSARSIGYHWFGGCAISQKYNNILTEKNYMKHEIAFSKIAHEIINIKIDENGNSIIENTKPSTSIVTAYYNRKSQFYQTLKSIANSKLKNFELIVVDDCSLPEHRLEDYLTEFPFMKIIRLEKKDKWYVNPCVPFNIGIKAAKGDIIILQNPECMYINDVLIYVNENITNNTYITMATYALDEKTTPLLPLYYEKGTAVDFLKTLPQKRIEDNPPMGWYNHSTIRPTYYHFCAAITKVNMNKLGGFDERFAMGIGFDDNDFIERVKRLKLNMVIADNALVVHQYHPTVFYYRPDAERLHQKNHDLFNNITMRETKVIANEKV